MKLWFLIDGEELDWETNIEVYWMQHSWVGKWGRCRKSSAASNLKLWLPKQSLVEKGDIPSVQFTNITHLLFRSKLQQEEVHYFLQKQPP